MSSGADLFVVCKHCGSEVSPYITECPYCGHRLRRRAPKLPRENEPPRKTRGLLGRKGGGRSRADAPPRARSRASRRQLSLPGADAERPYATIAIVAASAVLWVLLRSGYVSFSKLVVLGPLQGDWWKLFTAQFAYANGLYAFATLLIVAIFGWLLERRFGSIVVLALFLGVGAVGALVAVAAYPLAIVIGGNAGALALLAAWAAPDLRAARAGDYYEGDLLGAGALAALLLALPFVLRGPPEASWLAGVTGGVLGLLAGLGLQGRDQAGP
ncbi:MAG TPA: rhomboid family intramembrane serine protease [Solirubrobacteraceae bacterium]|jgi:membrane associated rhomboid family serine protease|nr:rhomboid family intramembrane serine protease [Solirubrobacteraceae bacterium]